MRTRTWLFMTAVNLKILVKNEAYFKTIIESTIRKMKVDKTYMTTHRESRTLYILTSSYLDLNIPSEFPGDL